MRKFAIILAAFASLTISNGAMAEQAARPAPAGKGGKSTPAAPPRSAPAAPASNANPKPANPNNDTNSRHNQNKGNEQVRSSERNDRHFDRNRTVVVLPWSNYYGWGYWSSPGYGPSYGDYGYYDGNYTSRDSSSSVNDLPSSLNGQARAEAELARSAMMEAQARLEKDFVAGDAYVDAAKEAKDAQVEYEAAVQKARARLKESGEYKDAVAEKREAQQRVDAAQAAYKIGPTTAPAGDSYPAQAVQAAQKKLDAATEVTQLEREQFGQDPEIQKARQRLDAASARLNQLKREFEASLANDPQWQSGKQRFDAAIGK